MSTRTAQWVAFIMALLALLVAGYAIGAGCHPWVWRPRSLGSKESLFMGLFFLAGTIGVGSLLGLAFKRWVFAIPFAAACVAFLRLLALYG